MRKAKLTPYQKAIRNGRKYLDCWDKLAMQSLPIKTQMILVELLIYAE